MRQHRVWMCLGFVALGSAAPLSAQTVTAFKTGERMTGMTKQCFYEALGSTYAQTVQSIELCPLNLEVRLSPSRSPRVPNPPSPPRPQTITAFKTGEQVTGTTKQCLYTALGGTYTRTVRSFELCPLSIKVSP